MRDQVFKALRDLGNHQDVVQDTHGNVSGRSGDHIWIKPSGMPYLDLALSDIIKCDIGTLEPVFGWAAKPSVDLPNHARFYEINPDITGICHTHSPYATAFAIANLSMPTLCTEHADYFGADIPCYDYEPYDVWGGKHANYDGAMLLGQHGVLTFSTKGPEYAVKLAIVLENIAKKYSIAASMEGARASRLEHKEIKKWYTRYNGGGYGQ